MLTSTMVEVCRGCRHPQAEHNNYTGCMHTLDMLGDRFECVCTGFEE